MAEAVVWKSVMEKNSLLKNLKLSSWEPLKKITRRSNCQLCGKSRKFYCYDCYELVNLRECDVPKVTIPVKIDIIKHKLELNSKSTSSHAKMLSNSVRITEFPNVPVYTDASRVILAYPSENSISAKEFVSSLPESNWSSLDTIVFIDSTWQQATQVLKHPTLENLKSVKISNFETCYWRPQRKSSHHLATIEAIFYLLTEFEMLLSKPSNQNRFDDLLYFYLYQYQLVEENRKKKEY